MTKKKAVAEITIKRPGRDPVSASLTKGELEVLVSEMRDLELAPLSKLLQMAGLMKPTKYQVYLEGGYLVEAFSEEEAIEKAQKAFPGLDTYDVTWA